MPDDPVVQPRMRRDNVCADDVRRIVRERRVACRHRGLLVERGTPPDLPANSWVLTTTIALLLRAASNAVQKDFHGGSDRLLR
ncbi:MAG: hypothetical protein E5V21_03840, partial [Mesorhizobium sp.]